MTHPTKFKDLNALLADFTAGHKEILGDNLIGLYLQGSAAVGDMDEFSDVDFVAVLERDLNEAELNQMRELTLEFFNRKDEIAWAEHFEGSYFPLDLLKALDRPRETVWYNDNGSKVLERNTHCNTLIVRWCLWEYAIPLVGPSFKTLIDPIPTHLMKQEVKEVMVDWEGWIHDDLKMYSNRFYQTFIVISYCRMLQTLATGRVYSKPAGVRWGTENLDPKWHSLITKAHEVRDDSAVNVYTPANPAEMQATLEFVTYTNKIAEKFYSQEQTNV